MGPARGGRIILIRRIFSRRKRRRYDRKGSDLVRVRANTSLSPPYYYQVVVKSLLLYALCYVTSPPTDLTVEEFRSHRVVYIADILVGGASATVPVGEAVRRLQSPRGDRMYKRPTNRRRPVIDHPESRGNLTTTTKNNYNIVHGHKISYEISQFSGDIGA